MTQISQNKESKWNVTDYENTSFRNKRFYHLEPIIHSSHEKDRNSLTFESIFQELPRIVIFFFFFFLEKRTFESIVRIVNLTDKEIR